MNVEFANVPSDKQQAGVRISKDLLDKVRQVVAEREQVTLNDVVEQALMEWYDQQPERERLGQALPSKPTKTGRPIKLALPSMSLDELIAEDDRRRAAKK